MSTYFTIKSVPYDGGEVEEHSLSQENKWDPLVVWYSLSFLMFMLLWYLILIGKIICVSHPAIVVGICCM